MGIDHEVQLLILKELLFNPVARYSDLNNTGMTTDHFNFHIKRLVELGIIEKGEGGYALTAAGLEIASKLDVKSLEMVRQPKIGILIGVFINDAEGEKVLVGERLKDPNKGKTGFYAGKVHEKELFHQAVARILSTETGLTPKTSMYAATVRILESVENDTRMDRLMIYFKVTEISGILVEKTEVSRNFWMPVSETGKISTTFTDFNEDLKIFLEEKPRFEERIIGT